MLYCICLVSLNQEDLCLLKPSAQSEVANSSIIEHLSWSSVYLRGFGVPLHNPLLDQFDQWCNVVKLSLLQDTL